MFMQAWGNYGTAWAVVHQWLGLRPDLGRGRLEIVPQVPDGQSTVSGQGIRLGQGTAAVTATHTGSVYTTEIDTTSGVGASTVVIGHTLPRGAEPTSVLVDGQSVSQYDVRTTSRGVEVTVPTTSGSHTLEIAV
jgi:hypothetical protein